MKTDAIHVRAVGLSYRRPWWCPPSIEWEQDMHPILDADGNPEQWQRDQFRLVVSVWIDGHEYGASCTVSLFEWEHAEAFRDLLIRKCRDLADASATSR